MGRLGFSELLLLFLIAGVPVFAVLRFVRATIQRGEAISRAEDMRRQQAIAVATPPPVQPVFVERLVERQVLVTRCRYCAQLVPVDISACGSCGAKL